MTRAVWGLGVVLALGTTGCCEILHLGWARSVSAKRWREIHPVTPAVAQTAKTDGDRNYDAATCARACPLGEAEEVEKCYPATAAVPADKSTGRGLLCEYFSGKSEYRTIPESEASTFKGDRSDDCDRACAKDHETGIRCRLDPASVRVPSPDELFVVCVLYRGGYCGGATLSQATCLRSSG